MTTTAPDQTSSDKRLIDLPRRIYDWTLSWADHPYGFAALCTLALVEAIIFPIPPDVLLIALVLGARARWFRLALGCTVASALGGMIGYGIGFTAWAHLSDFFFSYVFSEDKFKLIESLYNEYDFWIVFTAGFTPIPFKVITISAGVYKLNLFTFLIASLISRGARFFLVAWLLQRYGEPIREFIERRFNVLTLVFMVLLVGGALLIKLL